MKSREKDQFRKARSLYKQAERELKNYISECRAYEHWRNMTELPLQELVERWREMMDDQACNAKTDVASFIFSCYYDYATDYLDQIISRR